MNNSMNDLRVCITHIFKTVVVVNKAQGRKRHEGREEQERSPQ